MGDYRIRYGGALGPEGTYAMTSGLTLFPQADTTPDVSDGVIFYTNNSAATAITYFDLTGKGGIDGASQHEGKFIKIFFRDGNTTIVNGGQIYLSGTGGAIPANTVMDLFFHNSAWYESSRSQNGQALDVQTVTVGGTVNLNAAGASGFLLSPTAATTVTGFTNTVPGQRIWLAITPGGAFAGTAVTILGGTSLFLAGTTAIVMNNSAAYDFVAVNGTTVFSQSGLISP